MTDTRAGASAQAASAAHVAAGYAWTQGNAALRDGQPAAARLWLERALKLAPADPRIKFELANICLAAGAAGDPGAGDLEVAVELFAAIAADYQLAPAWLGLMTAHRLAGRHADAAAALAMLLARHCAPAEPQFAAVAALVARDADWAGWCGVSAAGVVWAAAAMPAEFLLDGRPVALAARDDGFALPGGGAALTVRTAAGALLGSPLDLVALRRVEGLADAGKSGIFGWACRPAAPAAAPELTLIDARGERREVAFEGVMPAGIDSPFLPRHQFSVPARQLRQLAAPFRLVGPDGADIFGSPVDPASAGLAPADPTRRGPPAKLLPKRRRLSVVVPVYRGLAETRNCLESLFAAVAGSSIRDLGIIVVDDASPEPALAAWLDDLAAARRITLLRQPRNGGFPAAANAGLLAAGRGDVLLLNSDTLVPPGAIEALLEIAYARADIGSVTPLSNQATICNYPGPSGGNAVPDLAATTRLNAQARRANGRNYVEIPTGIGFCMLLRHDCLAATGNFRGDIFAQGYGEENDWCLRARQRGFTHVAAPGVFVAHTGGVSFRAAGQALNERNAGRLNSLYPGYHEMVMAVIAADPLAPARRRLDLVRFADGRAATPQARLFISHNHGGGVARRVGVEMAAARAEGVRPLLLFPGAPLDPLNTPFPWASQLTDGDAGDYPNLRFELPAELPALLALLGAEGVESVALHHALGHHASVRELAGRLGVPQDIVLHDYASFCPRVNLLTRPEPSARLRYCGEPAPSGCRICLAINGDETFEGLPVHQVLARSAAEFAAARHITAPSADAAQRIARHFPGVRPAITPWEDDAAPVMLRPPGTGRRKIVVIGGIGPAKGFDTLIACAEDAVARDLPLDFVVAGASAEDDKLLQTGRIFVTGAYQERQAGALLARLGADLAFLPSVWPETWCFTLTEAWRAGLYVVAFDLGAQAARIAAGNRGVLLPLGLPASRINDALLAWQPISRNSHSAKRVTF